MFENQDVNGSTAEPMDPDAAIGAPGAGGSGPVGARAFLLLGLASGTAAALTAYPTGEWTTVSVV